MGTGCGKLQLVVAFCGEMGSGVRISWLGLMVALVSAAAAAHAVRCITPDASGECEVLNPDHWCRVSAS